MGKNKRRSKSKRESHCGPTCVFCRDPDWFKREEDNYENDQEFGPDEWTYGPDGEFIDLRD